MTQKEKTGPENLPLSEDALNDVTGGSTLGTPEERRQVMYSKMGSSQELLDAEEKLRKEIQDYREGKGGMPDTSALLALMVEFEPFMDQFKSELEEANNAIMNANKTLADLARPR
jgi:hypothetical protein